MGGVSKVGSFSAPAIPSFPPGLVPITETPMPLSWADDIPEGLFSDLPDLPEFVIHNAPSTLPPIFSPNPQRPHTPDNMEDAFAELGITDSALGYPATWEYSDSSQVKDPELSADGPESLWDDYEEAKPEVQELLCTDHGRICKKGICKTYSRQLREVEKAKKMAENRGGSRGKGRGKGRGGKSHLAGVASNYVFISEQGARAENNNNRRHDSKEEGRVSAPIGWGNSTSTSKSKDTIAAPESADDEDGFSVAGSSKRTRSRAGSIESDPLGVKSGWGTINEGPW